MPTILHCDINNFYASVECVLNPALGKFPVAVAGSPRQRHGVVLAKNELAKKCGVKTGDVIWEARQKCPKLICLPPQFAKYQEFSKQVVDIYARFTDKIESFGPDECWLDVTHSARLFGDGKTIADNLRKIVQNETGLTISVGVSFNKYFAKLGSDLKKPNATTVISEENFKQKIFNLSADKLIFIGKKTYKKLNKLNIFSIGDLAQADPLLLQKHFGIIGPRMQRIANGEDNTEICDLNCNNEQKSVGNGLTALRDITTKQEITSAVLVLSEKIAYRMRAMGVCGRTVHLTIKDSSLNSVGHSSTLNFGTNMSLEIANCAIELFDKFWANQQNLSVRAVRISVSNLSKIQSNLSQMTFFEDKKHKKLNKLSAVCDKIRDKYGYYSIRNANTINKDFVNYFEADKDQNDITLE